MGPFQPPTPMPKVRFEPNGRVVEIAAGESLLRAAILAGVHVNASCGGSGVCGKCRVVVEQGAVGSEPSAKLTAEQVAAGSVLACTSTVAGDVTVRIPVESQLGDTRAVLAREHRTVAHGTALTPRDLGELFGDFELDPATRRHFVELPPPTLEDNIGDLERLRRELARAHGVADFSVAHASWRGWPAACARRLEGHRDADRGGDGECPRLVGVDRGTAPPGTTASRSTSARRGSGPSSSTCRPGPCSAGSRSTTPRSASATTSSRASSPR